MEQTVSLRFAFSRPEIGYEAKKLRGKSPGTSAQYYTAIGHFGEHLKHEPTVDDLTDDAISNLTWWLIQSRGIVIDTAVSYTKKLLSLWRFICRHASEFGIAQPVWPELELPRPPERNAIAWTEPEVKMIYRALASQEGFIGSAPACLYWPALQLTFWDAPERLGAVIMLRPEDVNVVSDPPWVEFRAEVRKGKLRDRGYPLHATTAAALTALMGATGKQSLVFCAPFTEHTLRERYKGILRDAGLPHDRKRLFHCLRKTVASYWDALGHDATELLDHSSRTVTKTYISQQISRPPRPADGDLWRPTG